MTTDREWKIRDAASVRSKLVADVAEIADRAAGLYATARMIRDKLLPLIHDDIGQAALNDAKESATPQ